jgi:hypothetical protein
VAVKHKHKKQPPGRLEREVDTSTAGRHPDGIVFIEGPQMPPSKQKRQ